MDDPPAAVKDALPAAGEARRAAVEALRTVIDPEVGLDLVEMGCIYGLWVDERAVKVAMTLTTPGCPLGEVLVSMAGRALAEASGGRAVGLDLVWEPAWSPEMLGEEGRKRLGR